MVNYAGDSGPAIPGWCLQSIPGRCFTGNGRTGTHMSSVNSPKDLLTNFVFPLEKLPRLRNGYVGRPVCTPVFQSAFHHQFLWANKVYSAGGLRYWKDGREVPDVLLGTFDYRIRPRIRPLTFCSAAILWGTSGTTYLRLVGAKVPWILPGTVWS